MKRQTKIRVRETLVVEGRDDAAAVCAILDADVIITNGFRLRKSVETRIRAAARDRGIVLFTDPDHAGEVIRKRIVALFDGGSGETPAPMRIFHARLLAEDAISDGDIGVENASSEAIAEAVLKSGATCFVPPEIASDLSSGLHGEEGGVTESSLCLSAEMLRESARKESVCKQSERNETARKQSGTELFCESESAFPEMTDLMRTGLAGANSESLRRKVGKHFGIGYANAKQFRIRLRHRGVTCKELETVCAFFSESRVSESRVGTE